MPSSDSDRGVEATAEALATETAVTADNLAAETAHTADDLATETARKAVILADALTVTLGKVTDQLHDQAVYGKRNRRIIIALAISFTLDVILTVILGVTAVKTTSTANDLHRQAIQTCLNANVTRAGVIKVWESNIDTFHNNADGRAFLGLVRETYSPLNCERLR